MTNAPRCPPTRGKPKLTQRHLKRLAVTSVKQLTDTITAYIDHRNRDPAQYKWTAAVEDILAKVSRANNT